MNKVKIAPDSGKPSVAKEIDDYNFQRVYTDSTLPLSSEEAQLSFLIKGHKGTYIDLSLLKLNLGLRILDDKGETPKPL